MRLGLALVLCAGCRPEGPTEIIVGDGYACAFGPPSLECQRTDATYDAGEAEPPTDEFQSVVGSDAHLCGIGLDGSPVCWGYEHAGITEIPAGHRPESFFLGYENTCILDAGGHPYCWGNIWTGLNAAPQDETFVVAAAASLVACGQTEEGEVVCWGDHYPVTEDSVGYHYDWTWPEVPFTHLDGASGNICGLDDDGTIACWGRTDYGVTEPPAGTGYHHLTVGRNHACVLDTDDEVRCWGTLDRWRMEPEGRWKAFAAGTWVDCGIRDDGEIDCWGCLVTDPFTCDWDE